MIITSHALERYAERVSEKDKKEIPVFIAQNKDRIEEWIFKLYENSEYICSGKMKENNNAHYYINNDGWVIVVDNNKDKIITLYQIDLDVGSEFNKEYISKIKEKLKSEYSKIKIGEITLLDIHKKQDNSIKANIEEINILKKNIQYLEDSNKLLSQQKIEVSNNFEKDTREFYYQIERFIGNRIL